MSTDDEGQLLPPISKKTVAAVVGERRNFAELEELGHQGRWEGGKPAYELVLKENLIRALDSLDRKSAETSEAMKILIDSSAHYGAEKLPEMLKKDRCLALDEARHAAFLTITLLHYVFADKWPGKTLRRAIAVRLWLICFDLHLKWARQKERRESEHTLPLPVIQGDNDGPSSDPKSALENMGAAENSELNFASVTQAEQSEQRRALIGADAILKELVRECELCRTKFAVAALSNPPNLSVVCFRVYYQVSMAAGASRAGKEGITKEAIAEELKKSVPTVTKFFDECLKRAERAKRLQEGGDE